jgi:hypothetical protein
MFQRYYASNFGRFMSPDRYKASGRSKDPGSWNRYSYTKGDPANRFDPSGRYDCDPEDDACEPCPPSEYVGELGDPGDPCGGDSGGGGGGESDFYCAFSGSNTFPALWTTGIGGEGNQPKYGFYVPVNFTYNAVGGTGPYFWDSTQQFQIQGFGYTLAGKTISFNKSGSERLDATNSTTDPNVPTKSTYPTGPTLTLFDAPGLPLIQGGSPLWFASVYWLYELNASVTDTATGQTAFCPTVYWNANVWIWPQTQLIGVLPNAVGVANVITQATP